MSLRLVVLTDRLDSLFIDLEYVVSPLPTIPSMRQVLRIGNEPHHVTRPCIGIHVPVRFDPQPLQGYRRNQQWQTRNRRQPICVFADAERDPSDFLGIERASSTSSSRLEVRVLFRLEPPPSYPQTYPLHRVSSSPKKARSAPQGRRKEGHHLCPLCRRPHVRVGYQRRRVHLGHRHRLRRLMHDKLPRASRHGHSTRGSAPSRV